MSAYDQASILINRCKRILALVDTYVEKQTAATRADLRGALLDEFKAPAIAPPVAAGSVDADMDALLTACENAYRIGPYHGFISSLNAIRACAARQRQELLSTVIVADQAHQRADKAEARAKEVEAESAHKQSIIDRLMLEYCPDEMTAEQVEQWGKHQVRAAGQMIAATPGGMVFMNDGAEPGSGDLDCPACGGSGHAGDVPTGSAP